MIKCRVTVVLSYVWQLDSNGEREAGLRERADKAERVLGSVKAERETIEEDKKRVEAELSSLKQAARAAMLELASQRQKRDAEVRRIVHRMRVSYSPLSVFVEGGLPSRGEGLHDRTPVVTDQYTTHEHAFMVVRGRWHL
jgi:hypothetical protein